MSALTLLLAILLVPSILANDGGQQIFDVIGIDEINDLIISKLQSNLTNEQAADAEISQETQADLLNSVEKNLKTILTQEPVGELNYGFNLTTQKYSSTHHNENQTSHMMDKTVKGCANVNCEQFGKKKVLKVSANVTATFSFSKDGVEKFHFNKTVSFNGRIKMKGDEDKNKNLAYSRSFSVKSESEVVAKIASTNGTILTEFKENWISSHIHIFKHHHCPSNCTVLGTAHHHLHSKSHTKKPHSKGSKVLTVETSGNHWSIFTVCNHPNEQLEETIAETQPTAVTNNDNKL